MSALSGKLRDKTGKTASRQARQEELLPAVLYGLKDNVSLTINQKELGKILSEKGKNALIDLSIEGDSCKQRKVVLKELQGHPLKEEWVHVDFLEVAPDKKIKVRIPVRLQGQSPGEKLGGIVNHVAKLLDVECLPGNIPNQLSVNMEEVQLGQVVHVSDLELPQGAACFTNPGNAVVSVYIEKVKEEEVPEEGEVSEEEGAKAADEEDSKEEAAKPDKDKKEEK